MPAARVLAVLLLALILPAPSASAQPAEGAGADTSRANGDALRTGLILIGAYGIGGFAVMEEVWYGDRERVPFHFFNDNAAYLQVDKLGHAFGGYVQSYVGYHWLRKAGRSATTSLLFGGGLGFILQAPIEVMDGIHEGWGFSWGDLAANGLGSGLVIGQELGFGEQLLKYKFSYWGSRYAAVANGYLGDTTLERLLEDYNGHTYWLSIPLARLLGSEGMPPWLAVTVGYGANGMIGEVENLDAWEGVAIPETERYRQLLLSLDVDWTRIETDSRLLRSLFTALTFVKLPFPALELRSGGRLRGSWLYW